MIAARHMQMTVQATIRQKNAATTGAKLMAFVKSINVVKHTNGRLNIKILLTGSQILHQYHSGIIWKHQETALLRIQLVSLIMVK